jgi:hypothetical protein
MIACLLAFLQRGFHAEISQSLETRKLGFKETWNKACKVGNKETCKQVDVAT